MAEGTYARAVTGVLPTVTYPSHTTMVTGVAPATHGILYNSPFDPLHRNQDGWMWYAEDVKTPTLWDAANRAGFVSSSVDWPVTVGAPITYNIAQYWRATTDDDHKLLRALSTPGLLDDGEKAVGRYPAGYLYTVESDTRRSEFAAWLIAAKRPRIHTSYFSVLDEVQHEHGPATPEVFATIEAIDGMIDRVWKAAMSVDPRRGRVCGVRPRIRALRSNGFGERRAAARGPDRRGSQTGACATGARWHGGTPSCSRTATMGTRSPPRARPSMRWPPTRPAECSGTSTTRKPERKADFLGAAFVVGVKPGFAISGRVTGALVEPHAPGGTHGLLRELHEMDSAFFITGRGLPRGRTLDRIDMRDIAPTLARLAGVSLPQAEGHDLFAGK